MRISDWSSDVCSSDLLDPNINPDEPVLAEVEAIIAAHWKALRAKFSEKPVPIIRAVILHALYNIGIGDSKIARIIYLTATNYKSEERRVGKECVSTFRSRWSP